MLRLEGLRLAQGRFRLEADLEVPAGARVAVMGPSGGGKSTLLAGIAGFLAPEGGRVLWDGQDLGPLPPGQRPVSLMFQDNNLFPHLTVAENVGLGIRPALRLSGEERARVAGALERVGLSGLGDRRPGALSGGQQSRAGLARVLVAGRPLVLMDEPFAALGPGLRSEMLALVREVLAGTGRTLLMVTHDPQDAERIADGVILVSGAGPARAEGPVPVADLLADPPEALRDYLGR